MASTDMSLDDIINRRFSNSSRGRGGRGGKTSRGGTNRGYNETRRNSVQMNRRSNLTVQRNTNVRPIADARQRIIQNTREKMTDARDKLAEIAKQSDARHKLMKLRENRKKNGVNPSLRTTGGIVKRTAHNGKLSLTTSKGRGGLLRRNLRIPQRQTFNNEEDDVFHSASSVIRRTVRNDMPRPLLSNLVQQEMYNWEPQEVMRRPVQLPMRSIEQRPIPTVLSQRQEWNRQPNVIRRPMTIPAPRMQVLDSDEEDVDIWRPDSTGRMSSELKARLDTTVPAPRSMGILGVATAAAKPKGPIAVLGAPPVGHRIVVSNLQPTVTHEDIRELFEDLGILITSRLVRPGTAEVVYETLKDAVKAVDVYHNRQLDGQPMKCLLVSNSSMRSANIVAGSSGGFKLPKGGKSSVVPDVGTIHKALFNRS